MQRQGMPSRTNSKQPGTWPLLVALTLSLAQVPLGQGGQLLGSLFLLRHSEKKQKTKNNVLYGLSGRHVTFPKVAKEGRQQKQYRELTKGFLGRLPSGVEGLQS